MKRIFTLLVAIFASVAIYSNKQGHFFLNVEGQNVQVVNAENYFAQWLDLPANTTFTLFRDETDNLGIRHISYQQFVEGTIIQNGIVLVHAKNGIVNVVNGDIMDATIAAQQLSKRIEPLKAAQKVRKKANASDAQLKIIRAIINGEDVFRYAYEVMADDHSEKLYVDAETGEIIKTVPLVYNADVAGTVTTMYNGTQAISCYENEGSYYLIDAARGIYTLDATNNTYKINYEGAIDEEIMNAINASSLIVNNSTDWSSSWDYQLKSITITAILQGSWYAIGEGQADVYLKIKDKNNALIYTSGYKNNPTLPTTFNISTPIPFSSLPLSVEIWDYDPIGNDDIVDGFNIDTYGGNMFSKSWIGVSCESGGYYTSTTSGVQAHLDAHWGMEKTLDFYSQKLNRNSYDNQGSVVYQIVNMPRDEVAMHDLPLQAFAVRTGVYPMVYGTGLLSTNSALADACIGPLVSIDIMAHEFTHCVTDKNGNGGLVYVGEAGALNESFSDIIGIAVKNYATGSNDWLIGTGVVANVSNIRSMINPNDSHDGRVGVVGFPQPKTYNDNLYWVDPRGATDNGGVHTNSGVQNYWFYLLTEGGSGINDIDSTFSVTGIGIDKSVQIAYRNLIYYLTPEATFEDSRNGSIQAAIDLYGKGSQEHKSVVNAWYAVGVGDKYVDVDEEPTEYYIVAKRNSGNYYFFTPDKVSGKNRLIAVDAGTAVRTDIDTIHTTENYLWVFEDNKLKSHNGQYLACTAAKSAIMNTTGTELTITNNSDGSVTFSYVADTETRYLSLATAGNDYFVFYANTNQFTHLLMLPKGQDITTPISIIEAIPQAKKILRDGQIYILRGEKVYTLQGQEVK